MGVPHQPGEEEPIHLLTTIQAGEGGMEKEGTRRGGEGRGGASEHGGGGVMLIFFRT